MYPFFTASLLYWRHMQTYTGHCHCGAVRFEAQLDLTKPVISCNCSHCGMKGWLLTFIPATQFTLHSGEENLTEYRFNKKHIEHLFCKTCGVQCFARGKDKDGNDTYAVNVRTLDDVDLDALEVTKVDGKSL